MGYEETCKEGDEYVFKQLYPILSDEAQSDNSHHEEHTPADELAVQIIPGR